ncbi:MAG: DUF3311 domain-containing protein [Planctomycetes bacterium]|nr:DUF3311 domain-containing protein [Planctomycetota bacterium]
MKWIVALLVVLLIVLHQDFWWWDDRRIVLSFLPIGLAWHAGISVAASVVWWLAVKTWWPAFLDQEADPACPPPQKAPSDKNSGGETT